MDPYRYIPLKTLLFEQGFSTVQIAEVITHAVESTSTPIELWGQCYATYGTSVDEFLRDRGFNRDPRLGAALKSIIKKATKNVKGTYLDKPIEKILTKKGFSEDTIDKLVGVGLDTASTPLQLWAHWYSSYSYDTMQLLEERGVKNSKLYQIVEAIVEKVCILVEAEIQDDDL